MKIRFHKKNCPKMLRNKRLLLENHQTSSTPAVFFWISEMQHLKNLRQGVEPCVVAPGTSCRLLCGNEPTSRPQVQGEEKQPEEQAEWRIFMDFTDSIVVVMTYFKAITLSLYNLYCKQHMLFVCKWGADLLSLVDTDVDFWHPLLKGGQKQRRTETWRWSFKSVRNPKRFL